MSRTTGRFVALGFMILAFTVGQLLDKDTALVLGISPVILKLLSIFSGVIAIVTNYLPSVFQGDTTATTTTTSSTPATTTSSTVVEPPKGPVPPA